LASSSMASMAATAEKGRTFEECQKLAIKRGIPPHTNGPKNPWMGFVVKCEAGASD
jgi:hypothetical protein